MRPVPQRALFAGVHVGGTKILAGIFDRDLQPLGCAKASTRKDRGPQAVLAQVVKALHDAAHAAEVKLSDVRAVGVGLPGCVNPEAGVVTLAVNAGWKDVDARASLERTLEIPVFIDNDANLSLLGIYERELRRQPQTGVVLGIFIGSGIGGALLVDGQLYRGGSNSAAEVGHMIIDVAGPRCACGRRGCFEAFASRTAIFRDLRSALQRGQQTVLTEIVGKDLAELRSGHLRKAMRRADPLVRRVLYRAAEHAGVALSNLILLYDPGLIVLGGGLMEAVGTDLLPVIQRLCGEMLPKGSPPPPEIILSSLADSAGMTGGAVRARDHESPRHVTP